MTHGHSARAITWSAAALAATFVTLFPANARADDGNDTEEGELLDKLDAKHGKPAGGVLPARDARRIFVSFGLAYAAGDVKFAADVPEERSVIAGAALSGKFDAAEVTAGGGYRLPLSAIFDFRLGATVGFIGTKRAMYGSVSYRDPVSNESTFRFNSANGFNCFALATEVGMRAHLKRLSRWFIGAGPRVAVRWFTAYVLTNVRRGNLPAPDEHTTFTRRDLLVQGFGEVGVELGARREFELTLRLAEGLTKGGDGSTRLTTGAIGLGYAF
jgi:hypothetical protein